MQFSDLIFTLNLLISIIAMIPSIVLFKQFISTRIADYLIFGMVFLGASLIFILNFLTQSYSSLIIYQLHFFIGNAAVFFILWYIVRMRWYRKRTSPFWYVGVIWFFFLEILILFWKSMTQPEEAKVIFLQMPSRYTSYHPKGAGIKIDGDTILFSTSFPLLSDLFQIFIAALFLYNTISLVPIHPTEKIEKAKRLWIIAASFYLINSIIHLPWFKISEFTNLLTLLVFVIIGYITIRIPEGVLISGIQIQRIYFLLEKYHILDAKTKEYALSSIIDYLESIPTDLINIKK